MRVRRITHYMTLGYVNCLIHNNVLPPLELSRPFRLGCSGMEVGEKPTWRVQGSPVRRALYTRGSSAHQRVARLSRPVDRWPKRVFTAREGARRLNRRGYYSALQERRSRPDATGLTWTANSGSIRGSQVFRPAGGGVRRVRSAVPVCRAEPHVESSLLCSFSEAQRRTARRLADFDGEMVSRIEVKLAY